ncbi:MAG TPA: hypothetical protein VF941_13105 [Clostridia bacterium]
MGIEDIYKAIMPLKNRMHVNILIMSVAIGFMAGGAGTMVLSSLAVFFSVTYLVEKLLLIFSSCIFAAVIAALFLRPSNLKTIKKADSLGLQERLITSFELKDDDSFIAKIQRLDALKIAKSSDFKALYPLRFPIKICIIGVLLLIITVSTFLVPSKPRETAKAAEKLHEEILKESKKLEKAKDDINKKPGIPKEKLGEINKSIDKLLSELKESKKEEDALKALSMAEHKISDLKSSKNEGMGKLLESLMKNAATKELAEALKSSKAEDLKKAMKDLKESLGKIDEKSKKELSDTFKNAAGETDNKSLSKSLKDLSSALSSGENQASALSGLESALGSQSNGKPSNGEGTPSTGKALEDAVNDINSDIDDAKDSISMAGDGNRQMQANQGGEGNGEGQGSSEGEGDNGKGQGEGKNGNSKGGGGGAGSGTTNEDAGYSGEESSSSGGRAPGEKQVKDYESIYVPQRLGGDNKASQVKGIQGNKGQSSFTDAKDAPVQKGAVIPYNEVYGDYKDSAMSAIDNSAVPPVMKDAVREYFTSLD